MSEPLRELFGPLVRAKGIAAVAGELGVAPEHLTMWLSGRRGLGGGEERLALLCEVLGVTLTLKRTRRKAS